MIYICLRVDAAGICARPPPPARRRPRPGQPSKVLARKLRDTLAWLPGLASYGRPALRAARAAAAGSRKAPARGSLRSPAPVGAGAP